MMAKQTRKRPNLLEYRDGRDTFVVASVHRRHKGIWISLGRSWLAHVLLTPKQARVLAHWLLAAADREDPKR